MKTNSKAMILGLAGLGVIGLSLLHLLAGQTALRLVAVNGSSGAGKTNLTFRLEMQSGSNQVIYVLQSSTNLVNWESVVSGRAPAGSTIQVENVAPTNKARYFRVHEFKPNLVDTNPPAWSNSISPTLTVGAGGDVTVGWSAAGDDIGVASYLLYVNGVLVTNQLASLLTYEFAVDLHKAVDVRIAAMDASSNSTPILSLVYMPGDGIATLSDDSGRLYSFIYYQTNAFLTNGGFGARTQIAIFSSADRGMGIGDFDRDGILDLVAGGTINGYIQPYFLKGKGDGTFATPVAVSPLYGAGGFMTDVAVGDFDGDGNLDFVTGGDGSIVGFYWGNGDGTFALDTKNWGERSRGIVAGDFNEDGREDLVRASCCSGITKIFLGNGDRTFIETNLLASGIANNDPYAVAAGDFDEDGHMDLLVSGGGSGDVYYYKGLGDGTFTNLAVNGLWANLRTGTYGAWDAFDYDGDGHLDLVMASYNGQGYFWSGNGDGTFSSNRVTIATGMSSALGASAPPRPPRVDVNIAPLDAVTNLNGTVTFYAYGNGITTNDFFRWSHGDNGTNPVAWTFGAGTNYGKITTSHTYTNEGRFVTRLWHTATNGINSVRGTWVTVKGAPPVANPGGPYTFGSQVATSGVWYVTVDGSASTDDFGIATYIWDFGDGQKTTNGVPVAMHGYPSNGVYALKLTVLDAARQSDTKATTVTLTNGLPPVAVITGPAIVDETAANCGTWTATYSATNSTGPVGIWQYAWRNLTTGQTGNGSSFQTSWYGTGTNYVSLIVTGNDSQTNGTVYTVWVKANALPVPVIQGPHLLAVNVSTNGYWFGAWNATNSTDDTGLCQYSWSFGDGATATGTKASHSYSAAGVYPLVLSVTDNGRQTVATTQSVIVVAGNPPVAKITASTLSPEGAQPILFSAVSSTSDNGISQYAWFLPPLLYGFDGQVIDKTQWQTANTVQSNKLTLTGQGGWGSAYFYNVGAQIGRGTAIEGRVDTPSTANTYAMVGLRNLDFSVESYQNLAYAVYFVSGNIQIYEYGNYRGQPASYSRGTSYDFRIETKLGAGARYYLRPTGSGQPFALIFEDDNYSDTTFSFGADVHTGVWAFDDILVQPSYLHRDITAAVYPGGTVTLVVTDSARLTNAASVVVTPVVGNPPIAGISGPTNGLAGVELAFDAYSSSDDYAIASYVWDFGDGTTQGLGPAVNHHYSAAGTYTNTVTVWDYAEQSSTASMVVTISGSNTLVHVPWLFVAGIEQPHETYSGKTNTLKAVARGIEVPFTAIWDFGDASGTVTNVITNYSATVYNLEARHPYIGGDGTPYYATVTVELTNGTVMADRYPLLMRAKTIDIEEKVAIDEGLWYIHKTQSRYNLADGSLGGDWTSVGYKLNATASSVSALAVSGHLLTDDANRDPYVDTVQRGVNFLLNSLGTVSIGTQTYGDPDVNGNGIGLQGLSSRPIYESGPIMDAFVAAARPELVAATGGVNVKGRQYKDIVQDMVDMYAWGQYDDPTYGGGWRYSWNEFPDNSACQWGAIGMLAAERFWGIGPPQWVKDRNLVWVAYSAGSVGYGYTGPGEGIATTPSALVQLAYDGVATTNSLWQHGEVYLANNWSGGQNFMSQNNVYANYSIAKAMRTANPQPVHNFTLTGKDWFLDPNDGLARITINRQFSDGSWTSSSYVDAGLATPWSVLILSSSLFQQGPVAVINVSPNPSAIGYPVVFDGRNSYHKHPSYKIMDYRWIFDSSKGLDFEHPDATGPVVTNVYGAFSTNTIYLQVRDNSTPQLLDVASVVVQTRIPPYPPTADAGGPYVACAGADVHLDASGSFCVDAANGNFIQSYDWEVHYAVPVTFNQGVTGVKATVTNGYPVAGNYTVGLRVKNANSLVYTNVVLLDETSDAFTTVFVYDRVIADLSVRPKATKAQLTWTKAGDYGMVMRSSQGPNRGFVQVGQTDSSYATYLDTTIDYNTDYYYRIYAYRKGQDTPIGVSDPVFLHSAPRSFDEHAPHFQSTPLRIAKVGQLYEVTLDAVDPENKPLHFSMLEGPTNLTVNATSGLVDYTPTFDQIGNQFLSFQVTNTVGRDVLSYTLFVFPATNHVPVVNVNGPYAALISQQIQFSSAGTSDEDGNALRYYWNFGDGSTSTNPNPVHIYGGIGDYLVSLYVNDGYGGTASAQTHAQITRPNRAPVVQIANAPNFSVRLGETLTLNGSGSYDLDGDPTTYRWTWGDGVVNANAGTSQAHLYAAIGSYTGNLVVADNRGGAGTNVFHVTVGAANQAPVVAFTVSTNNPYVMSTVTLDASSTVDPDGDPMAYNWDFGDRAKTTGPLVTHVFKEIQDFLVTLTVTDTHGGVSVATQTVHVVNAPPVFTSQPPLLTRAGTNYTYTPEVSDVDDDAHTFQLVGGPATMSCDTNTGTLSWLPGTNNLGTNPIVLRVTDENGGSADQAYTLVVTTPLGPQIDLQPTHLELTNMVVDGQSLALSGTVRVYLKNNGSDGVPVPFTVSVFVDGNGDGAYSTNTDWTVSYGVISAGFPAGGSGYVEMSVSGQALMKDGPVYAFVDSQNVVPEYNKFNNIMRSGSDLPTNGVPVVDLSAAKLEVGRQGLPTNAVLTARLGNVGLVSVPTNVPMAFYDGDPKLGGQLIGVSRTTNALAVGHYAELSVNWAGPAIQSHTVYVVADDPGTGTNVYPELNLSNNVLSVEVDLAAILPPVADAGPSQGVNAGDTVVLNGRGSSDPQGWPLTYRWSMVSIPIGSHSQLTGANTASPSFVADTRGYYTAQLVVNNGLVDSTNAATVSIAVNDTNVFSPPTITSTPSFQGMVGVLYSYQVVATDPQSKPLTYRLPKAPNGMTLNTNSGLVRWTPTNTGSFLVQVAADGVGGSYYQGYTLTVIAYTNLPPEFTSTPMTTAEPNAAYTYAATAVDQNNDTVTYSLTKKPSGMSINSSSGLVSWTPTAGQMGANAVVVTASDGHGGATTQSYNLVVLHSSTNGPVVQPIPDQTINAPAAFATISLDNYVSDPVYAPNQISWSVTGTNQLSVTIDSNRVATVFYSAGANVAELLTFLATDPAGNSAYSSPTFTVVGNTTPPVAAIANLSATDTTSIPTSTFNLLGTADDPGVPVPVAYRIGLYDAGGARVADVTPAPKDAGGWHEGRVPAGGSLGTLDFSLVRNGSYTLMLEVQANGQVANATAQIALDAPLKIGQLTFAQQDLVLPVQGVGLRVARTYDSLNSAAGDFGYSWSYSVADLAMTVDDQRVQTQDDFDGGSFSLRTGGSWDVTLTMPDTGRRVTFRFSLLPGLFQAHAYWTPPAWVKATLAPTCSATLITLPGGIPPMWQAAGEGTDWQAFDWPGFVLTLQNGTQYLLSRQDLGEHFYATDSGFGGFVHSYTGGYLSRITQVSGEHTEFVRAGTNLQNIVQFNATNQQVKSILFQRDNQKRINGVFTPEHLDAEGNPNGPASVSYTYDALGNLATASKLLDSANPTNPAYATFKYFYSNPQFPHLLTEIDDPRGIPVLRAQFDSQGKLVGTLDANGHLTAIDHNPDGQTTTVFDRMGNATQLAYDKQGNVVSRTDPLGNTTTYTYDANNRETSVTDPLGNTTSYTYDASGNPTQVKNALGNSMSLTYSTAGMPTSFKDPLGHTVTNILDSAGRPIRMIDSLGNVTVQKYDDAGNVTDLVDASGHRTAHLDYNIGGVPSRISNVAGQTMNLVYDASGHVTSHQGQWVNPTNANDIRVISSYVGIDYAGRVTNRVDPLGNSTSRTYDDLNNLTQITDSRGNVVSNSYDAVGNLIESRDSAGLIIRTVYDANDNPVLQVDAHLEGKNANGTQLIYDAANRLVSSVRLSNVVVAISSSKIGSADVLHTSFVSAGGVISSNWITYDAAGRQIAVTDAAGQTTRYEYDAVGNKTAVIDALGNRTTLVYDEAGHNTAIRDPLGNETDFLYDANGRLTKTVFPNGASASATFTATGLPESNTDVSGNVRRVIYDDLGVPTGIVMPAAADPENGNSVTNPVFMLAFDVNRNLRQMVDPKGRITSFAYDQFNRRTGRTLPLGQCEQTTYDAAGNVARVTDFNGQGTEFQYDSFGRVMARKLYAAGNNSPAETVSFHYDELSRLVEIGEARGQTRMVYDSDHRVVQVAAPEGTVNYAYDPATGRKTRSWTDNSDEYYGYDALGRLESLTAVKRNGQVLSVPEVTTYSYSATGNRASTTLPNGIQTLYTYDQNSRLSGLNHVATNGAMLMSFAYQYDTANRRTNALEMVTGADGALHTNSIAYAYDSLSRLVSETAKDLGDGHGYQAAYTYDLVGNRLLRSIATAGKTLTTYYTYDANDRLLMESNVVTTGSSGGASFRPRLPGPDSRFATSADVIAAKLCYVALKAVPYGLLAAFLFPVAMTLYRRRRTAVLTLDLNAHRALFPRCLCAFLAAVMCLIGFDNRVLANQAVYYAVLTTDTWGVDGSVTQYQYDANGSMIQKVTVGPKAETSTFQYTLSKQLAVSTRSYTNAGNQVVETAKNAYNHEGIRVRTEFTTSVNGVVQGSHTNFFLVDSFNLTGFAQVIEELPAIGAVPTVSYTFGTDIIAQSANPSGVAQYLLKDGHDSTRQVTTSSGAVTDYYGYDAYGMMLGGNPNPDNPSATKMLYSGEQFDSNTGLYNLRARFYSPNLGRFTTMDTNEGSPQDPPSLHKYAYCTGDPVNYHDPSGHMEMAEILTDLFIISVLAAIVVSASKSVIYGGELAPDAAMFGVGVTISGNASITTMLNMASNWVHGAGVMKGAGMQFTGTALSLASVARSAFSAGGGTLGFAEAGKFAGGSMNFGWERLYTTEDHAVSGWHYYGPGFYLAPGTGAALSGSVTFYAGVCWNVSPDWNSYSGGFYTLGLGAGSTYLGWSVNYFWSDSNPKQNGYNVGFSVGMSYPPSKGGWSFSGINASWIDYKGSFIGAWDQATWALLPLSLVPGVNIWVPFLAWKWAFPTDTPKKKS